MAAASLAHHEITFHPPRTSLVGRDDEVAAIFAMLTRQDVPLLTLTGTAGVGKTRLALQIAAELRGRFADGVAVVPLAPIDDSNLVAATIAQTLGIREHGDWTVTESLEAWLGQRQLLLVLDNFEQVVAAAPLVSDLVSACPRITVLVTSRTPLRVSGEHEFPVQPLELPDQAQVLSVDSLSRYASTELFVDRAHAVNPHFQVTTTNAPIVAEICRRLDGLPLAIELAAARIKVLSPEVILARLDHRLSLLTGGPRDASVRLQTLRNAIAWSYDLLTPDVQRLFRELSVFTGGWTLEAAEAVCSSPGDLLDRLSVLVDQSLVYQVQQPDGSVRFSMLETIREYGLEQLAARNDGEQDAIRDRHADFVVVLVEEAGPKLHGPELAGWLNRLNQEHGNIRAALAYLHERRDAERAQRIVGELVPFWDAGSLAAEGLAHAEAALTIPGGQGPTTARLKALSAAAWMAVWQGQSKRTLAFGAEGLALSAELEDQNTLPSLLFTLGLAAQLMGNLGCAIDYWRQTVDAARAVDDTYHLSRALKNLSMLTSDLDQAITWLEESLPACRAAGNSDATALTLISLASRLAERGDLARAAELNREALALYRDLGHHALSKAFALETAGELCVWHGDPVQAVRLFAAARTTHRSIGARLRRDCGASYIQAVVESLHAALDDDAYQAAWEAGVALPLDDAVAEALAAGTRSNDPALSVASATTTSHGLTSRELEILREIVAGKSNKEIAADLFLSARTVERHIANLYLKINVHNKAEATAYALRHQLA